MPSAPDRTVSFRLSSLPPPEEALLDVHVPVLDDQFSPLPAGTVTLLTRLTLCGPAVAGRTVPASLRLKRAPRRPHWRHAIVSDWLAQLSVGPAAGARDLCLQVVLPPGDALTLDRSGYRAARLTARPPRRRAGWTR